MKCLKCDHLQKHHIYEEGPCRGGFVCNKKCKRFMGPTSTEDIFKELNDNKILLKEYINERTSLINDNKFLKEINKELEEVFFKSIKKLKELNQIEFIKEIKNIYKGEKS